LEKKGKITNLRGGIQQVRPIERKKRTEEKKILIPSNRERGDYKKRVEKKKRVPKKEQLGKRASSQRTAGRVKGHFATANEEKLRKREGEGIVAHEGGGKAV